jgi:PmbA protein
MKIFCEKDVERARHCLALAQSLGASAADIKVSYGTAYGCSFEAGRLKQTGTSETLQYSLSVIVNGHRGDAGGNRMDALEEMTRRAVALAAEGAVAHFAHYPAPGQYAQIRSSSDTVRQLTRAKLIDDCTELVDFLKSLDAGLDIQAGGGRSEGEGFCLNSGGFFQEQESTSWSLAGAFCRVEGEDMLFSGSSRGWGEVNEFYDLQAIKKELQEDYQYGIRPAGAISGVCPVLFAPQAAGRFLAPVLAALNGRSVFKGTSPLKDKLGQRCFDAKLTVRDEPHLDYAPGSSAYDDAGLPTRPVTLIDAGMVRMFLYDYDTAHLAGVEPTAHSGCEPYNVRMQLGDVPSGELLRSIKRGLYVKHFLGFGQGNIGNGDFSTNVALGFLVENGEIVGRVKNMMLAGNIFELFKQDLAISSDCYPTSRLPYLLFPAVSVASK